MSPKQEEEEYPDVKDSSIKSEDESPPAVADATHKQAAKRRTKTGCLSMSAILSELLAISY